MSDPIESAGVRLSDPIESVAGVLMLVMGGAIAIVDRPPLAAMAAATIVVAGAVQAWLVRGLVAEERRPWMRFLFLLGAALMLTGW